jgi:2'-5' RNA ligase
VGGEGAKIRVFFAVELDAAPRRAAAAWMHALRARSGGAGVRWVREENLHVTLRFLGNIAPEAAPELVRLVGVETAALEPFRLQLGAGRLFPSERRPRVIALELEPHGPLSALAGAVERGVVAAGFAAEARPFNAHLTLGRVKGKDRAARHIDVTAPDTVMDDPGDMAQDVRQIVLFRSELHRSGAKYTPLERVPVGVPGGSDHP